MKFHKKWFRIADKVSNSLDAIDAFSTTWNLVLVRIMTKLNVLVIEDEIDIQQLVSYNLIRAGFHVTCADSGEEGIQRLNDEDVDCVLLDLMLPGMSGMDVCRAIRKAEKSSQQAIPIIMLTARGEEEDMIAGFNCGADDYITKPFSPGILVARIKAVVKRIMQNQTSDEQQRSSVIKAGDLRIDKRRHEAGFAGEIMNLTTTEFSILALLASRPGWVFTRQQIIDSVRGYDFLITPRAIDVQIFGLRKKMGVYGELVETVRGIGYRYKADLHNRQHQK